MSHDAPAPVPAGPAVRVITGRLCTHRRRRGRAYQDTPEPTPDPVRHPARVARVLALAHRLRERLERGEHESHTALARALGIAVPRLTQLLTLTFLAPEIQEVVLELEAIDGVEPLCERRLREVVTDAWDDQCEAFRELQQRFPPGSAVAGGDEVLAASSGKSSQE